MRCMLISGLALAVMGCGSRSLSVSDGSPAVDSGVRQADAVPASDVGCDLPAGYCRLGGNDCPAGSTCTGCYACRGKAYWSCGCSDIVFCSVCSSCIGKCVTKGPPPKICATNSDCLPSEFCLNDGHCVVTGAIAGTCTPRPTNCPIEKKCSEYLCGCDGKTYCDECTPHAAGVSVATKAACIAPTCDGLRAAYRDEVQKAKQCCAACATPQCLNKVPAELICGCDTTINSATTPGMQAVRDEWLARGCMLGINCPAIKCAQPMSGLCNADPSGSGSCADFGKD